MHAHTDTYTDMHTSHTHIYTDADIQTDTVILTWTT